MKYILGALAATTARATFDSLDSCTTFAELFNGTCGSETVPYADLDSGNTWVGSTDVTCSVQDSINSWDPDYFLSPNIGAQIEEATITS